MKTLFARNSVSTLPTKAAAANFSSVLQLNFLWILLKKNSPGISSAAMTPNILPMIIMNLAGSLGGVIMMEASMNFLGFGVSVNTPSWGAMLSGQGRSNMYVAPWLAMVPGIAIAIMVFASAMLGDGVRDILDPRLKGGVGSYAGSKLKKIVEQKKQDLHMI